MENINDLGAAIEEYQRRLEAARQAQMEVNAAGRNLIKKIAPDLLGIMTPTEALSIARRLVNLRKRMF